MKSYRYDIEDERRYEQEQQRQAYEDEFHRQQEEAEMRYEVHLIKLRDLRIKEILSLMNMVIKELHEK
jgi:hypothetical protein